MTDELNKMVQYLTLWQVRVLRTHWLWCVVGSGLYNQLQYHPNLIGQFKGQSGTGQKIWVLEIPTCPTCPIPPKKLNYKFIQTILTTSYIRYY